MIAGESSESAAMSQKIAAARKKMIEEDKNNKAVLDNYLRMLNAQSPKDLEEKIKKAINKVK